MTFVVNMLAASADKKSILLYSAKKNRANTIDPYSTLYPATSSASASGKSNGARLVSASIVTINNNTNINDMVLKVAMFHCTFPKLCIFAEPANNITINKIIPIVLS